MNGVYRSKGKANMNSQTCLTNTGFDCDFEAISPVTKKKVTECQTYAIEGYSKPINTCIAKDSKYQTAICSNNCKGVDPKTIIVGGLPILASATVGVGLAPLIVGFGGLTTAITGTAAVGFFCLCWTSVLPGVLGNTKHS